MKATFPTLRLPITLIRSENPLPMLRDPNPDKGDLIDGGLLESERPGFAKNTGYRVLPYRMQDDYEPEPRPRDVPCAILENENLVATFLPSLGGRLYSLVDKRAGRECLFKNPVIKLGNLALRNAWFSGGVEWNYGHFGHTFFSSQPVHFAVGRDAAGNEFLRLYEFERASGTVFQADFHLPSGATALTAHLVCVNPADEPAPLFLWTNTAVTERGNPRVFSGTDGVIAQHLGPQPQDNYFLHADMPDLYGDGTDHSRPAGIPHAEEYFFQNENTADSAYEVSAYEDGQLFIDRSTGNYPYRKMFCWGGHPGGMHWKRHLSDAEGGEYLEVQAGLARTQVHGCELLPGEVIHITQLFAPAMADPHQVQGDYAAAGRHIRAVVDRMLPVALIESEHARCMAEWDKPAKLAIGGTGWGALESARDPGYLPRHLNFPPSELGEEQRPWLELLSGKPFSGTHSFQTAKPWLRLLEKAAESDPTNAELLIQLGLARCEQQNREGAMDAFRRSAACAPSPLAHRCTAYALWQRGAFTEAAAEMGKAVELLGEPQRAYAEEYLLMLTDAGQFQAAYDYYNALPAALKTGERMSLTAALSALEVGDDAFLDSQYARRFSVVKEGERRFTDTWFAREARREAARLNIPCTKEFEQQIRASRRLPENIDFRMV